VAAAFACTAGGTCDAPHPFLVLTFVQEGSLRRPPSRTTAGAAVSSSSTTRSSS